MATRGGTPWLSITGRCRVPSIMHSCLPDLGCDQKRPPRPVVGPEVGGPAVGLGEDEIVVFPQASGAHALLKLGRPVLAQRVDERWRQRDGATSGG